MTIMVRPQEAPEEARLHQALLAEREGRKDEARALSLSLPPGRMGPAPTNSLGSLLMRLGETARALAAFESAARSAPLEPEYPLNRAIALDALGRGREALDVLVPLEPLAGHLARYWSVRAAVHRQLGDLAQAQRCYRDALARDAAHPRARQGLAQTALERGEPEAVRLFEELVATGAAGRWIWRNYAEALANDGQLNAAVAVAGGIVRQMPHWTPALELLAKLRTAAGEIDSFDHYDEAMARCPDEAAIPASLIALMAGRDRYADAARVAGTAAVRFPEHPQFRLMEAVHAGNAGNSERAEAIFADLALDSGERHLHEARHRLRLRQHVRAGVLLDRVLAIEPWNVSAWALRDLAWRASGDTRHRWLHGYCGAVRQLPLAAPDGLMDEAVATLRRVHAKSALPLDQSLRGGTQTPGSLFARHEGVFARLQETIGRTLERYRSSLPSQDATHPLLRHRDAAWRVTGSWSVRLMGGGDHHTAHIHPHGILSSACYLVVPPCDRGEALLELGRPPPDLRMDLPALQTIVPEPGTLALFPSTLYHGTTPFPSGERITVAFDVAADVGGGA